MSQQQEIVDRMAALRAAGTATAERLPAAWQRATDWHEYVRAYPWQAVGVAVAVGYLMIPKRRRPAAVISPAAAADRRLEWAAADAVDTDETAKGMTADSSAAGRSVRSGGHAAVAAVDRGGLLRSAAAPLRPWLIGFVQQAAQRVLMNQIHQFSHKLLHDVSATADAQQSSEPYLSQRGRAAGSAATHGHASTDRLGGG